MRLLHAAQRGVRAAVVNGRAYPVPPKPVVVVCIDGSAPGYIEAAVDAGVAPFFQRLLRSGTHRHVRCAMPAFTNPNNVSIVTGVSPKVHGICGNYFYDAAARHEVLMNDPALLRVPTILAGLQAAGCAVAAVTAKDKLLGLLSKGIQPGERGICFSAEKADSAAVPGVPSWPEFVNQLVPAVYSAELSEFVLLSGVRLMECFRPDVLYLSTSDFIQHTHAPGTTVANLFYAALDGHLQRLADLGAAIAITADHGMSAKHTPDGVPLVVHLQSLLDAACSPGACRVLLPITDPYVKHHGALGSFATVYVDEPHSRLSVGQITNLLRRTIGVEQVLPCAEAAEAFLLPPDRIGDLVVVSEQRYVLGLSPDRHDLSQLTAPLRSHGGLAEQTVPLLSTEPLPLGESLWNYDMFHLLLNAL